MQLQHKAWISAAIVVKHQFCWGLPHLSRLTSQLLFLTAAFVKPAMLLEGVSTISQSQCASDDVIMCKKKGEIGGSADAKDANKKGNLQTRHTGTHVKRLP